MEGRIRYKPRIKDKKEGSIAFLFIALPLIGFLVFTALSMGVSVYYSFGNINIMRDTYTFIGFGNYITLFQDEKFWDAVLNTVIFLITIPIGMFIGLLLATYIQNLSHGSKLLRILYYLPAVCSAVAINIIWQYLFQMDYGLINTILGTNIPWLGTSNPALIKIAICIKNVWAGIGGTMILYAAGLNAIPDSYYEAARIDGASTMKQFFTITIPLIHPTTFYLIITGIIGGLQSYTDAQVFAEGNESARTIVYYIWYYGIDRARYGLASAAATFLGVVIMLITIIQFRRTKILDN